METHIFDVAVFEFSSKMSEVHHNLLRALMGVKSATTTSLGAALAEIGFKTRTKKPSQYYDSFCHPANHPCLHVSYNEKFAKIWIYGEDIDIAGSDVPRDLHDIVLVVRASGNAITSANEIFSPELIAKLDAPPIYAEATPCTQVCNRIYLKLTNAVKNDGAILAKVFGPNPPATRPPFFATVTQQFLTFLDKDSSKAWNDIGFGPLDKEISVQAIEAFLAAEPTGAVHIPFALTGELAMGLRALGWKDRIICHEPHALCAMALRKEIENTESSAQVIVVERDPMATTVDVRAKTANPLGCLIARLPFVTAKAYAKGYPATKASAPAPVCPLPAMKDSASVGSLMLLNFAAVLAPGAVGTFVVPENFAVTSTELPTRESLLVMCEIVSLVPTSSSCKILTVRRRTQSLQITTINVANRQPELSSPYIRWIKSMPCFVDDHTIIGVRAGEKDHPTLGSIITGVALFNASKDRGGEPVVHNAPGQGLVPLRGHSDRYVAYNDPAILCVNGATLFVHRPISETGILVLPHDGTPVAIGTNTVGICTSDPERVRKILESPETLRWILAVLSTAAISRRFSEDLLVSIPI